MLKYIRSFQALAVFSSLDTHKLVTSNPGVNHKYGSYFFLLSILSPASWALKVSEFPAPNFMDILHDFRCSLWSKIPTCPEKTHKAEKNQLGSRCQSSNYLPTSSPEGFGRFFASGSRDPFSNGSFSNPVLACPCVQWDMTWRKPAWALAIQNMP